MDLRGFGRSALNAGTLIALVSCGGGTNSGVVPTASSDHVTNPHQRTFHYVDKPQKFTVPAGVTSLTVVALGAGSGGGAHGGRVFAVIPVTPEEELYVYVGGAGIDAAGGFNGGGSGAIKADLSSYGGGGASDLREGGKSLANRVIVAGGAGGTGGSVGRWSGGKGGKGGDPIGGSGGDGYGYGSGYYGGGGGSGGTQSEGGTGGGSGRGSFGDGSPGANGSLADGGAGGVGGDYTGAPGGGGGGGYYGGGGGGSGGTGTSEIGAGGGGGGGSSYVESYATRSRMWQGWYTASGFGLVVISW